MSFLTDTEFRGEGPGMCVWGGMTIGSWVVSQELLESAYDMHSGLWCIYIAVSNDIVMLSHHSQ